MRNGDGSGRDRSFEIGVDERHVGVDAKLAQECDEQQRLVLAVAEPPVDDGGRRKRLVRVLAELDPEVAHVVLHEPYRREHAGRQVGSFRDASEGLADSGELRTLRSNRSEAHLATSFQVGNSDTSTDG